MAALDGEAIEQAGLNRTPGRERGGDGAIIQVIQFAADGHAMGKSGHGYIRALQAFGS